MISSINGNLVLRDLLFYWWGDSVRFSVITIFWGALGAASPFPRAARRFCWESSLSFSTVMGLIGKSI